MPVSETYRDYVLEQLARVVPRLRSRRMFGGVGIYDGDLFFALIAGDTLFFKADDVNRPEFEARGLQPFRPFEDHHEVMSYYAVGEETIEDVEELRQWAAKSIDAARRKKAVAKPRAKSKRRSKPQKGRSKKHSAKRTKRA